MYRFYVIFVVYTVFYGVGLCQENSDDAKSSTTVKTTVTTTTTQATTTNTTGKLDVYPDLSDNLGAVKRGFYVFIGVTAIVAIYLGIRVYRSRKQKVKSYGLLSSGGENMELNALNSDSDDDYTVFEAKPIY